MSQDKYLIMGRFGAPFGIKGEIKIQSYAEPPENLCEYENWYLQTDDGIEKLKILTARYQAPSIIAKIAGIHDRDEVRRYTNQYIAIEKTELAALDEGEFYWDELTGFSVIDQHGQTLGQVQEIFNTGANDILAVRKENSKKRILIPFILDQFVMKVDTDQSQIIVDWEELGDEA